MAVASTNKEDVAYSSTFMAYGAAIEREMAFGEEDRITDKG
jgi:hypothetical protein